MDDRIRDVLSAVFRLNPTAIGEDLSSQGLAAWDSLKHMQVVVALEQEFGVEFEDAEIPRLLSFRGIRDVLRGKAPTPRGP
jgi:acyl carrier protein